MKFPDWLSKPAALGTLFAVSLAGNLFLGGIVAGHFGASGMTPPPLFAPGTDTLFRLIPDRERRAMREHLHANHPEVMEAHRNLRKLHREISQELGKEELHLRDGCRHVARDGRRSVTQVGRVERARERVGRDE